MRAPSRTHLAQIHTGHNGVASWRRRIVHVACRRHGSFSNSIKHVGSPLAAGCTGRLSAACNTYIDKDQAFRETGSFGSGDSDGMQPVVVCCGVSNAPATRASVQPELGMRAIAGPPRARRAFYAPVWKFVYPDRGSRPRPPRPVLRGR